MAWTKTLPGVPALTQPLVATMPRLLRLPAVLELVGLSEPTLYEQMAAGTFPKGIKIAKRAVAWREDHLIAWLASREAMSTPAA
jgi:prophage regulatory protein